MLDTQRITRRSFVAGAAGTLAVIGLGGLSACAPSNPSTAKDEPAEQLSCDVIVVGGGVSGAVAALRAADNGASVILVEKEDMIGGTSALATGNFTVADTDAGIEAIISEQAAVDELSPETPYPDTDRVRATWKQQKETFDYMQDLGIEAELNPDADKGTTGGHWKNNGGGLMQSCSKLLDAKGVTVMVSAPATELLVDDAGAVVGVSVDAKGGKADIEAKKVIVATGGTGRGEDVMERFLPQTKGMDIQRQAGLGVTGDGFGLIENAGGALYDSLVFEGGGVQPVEAAWNTGLEEEIPWRTTIGLDADGVRYTNEAPTGEYVDNQIVTYYAVDHGSPKYYWLHDHSDAALNDVLDAGVEAGAVLFGSTLAELAQAMGCDAAKLQQTFDTYQGYCETGVDEEFHKAAEFLVPYQTDGGFYAVEASPICWGTVGGAQTDDDGRVLDAKGSPVANLFAVGEMSNRAFYSDFYIAGDSMSLYPTTGRLAADAAVAELA